MAKFPLSNESLKWLDSYSSNRKQFVKIGTSSSQPFVAHSAVAQGTICGPLLFLSYFNDSDEDITNVNIFNFADDKKQAATIKSFEDTKKLQRAIDKFVEWCEKNGLELSIEKCLIMTFYHKKSFIKADYNIKGVPIKRSDVVKDLGVIMDRKLSFVQHMEYAKKKAETMWAFVKRECYKSFNVDIAKILYGSLVRSHLEFASVVWNPSEITHRKSIESVQKGAVIYLRGDNINRQENKYLLPPYDQRCVELNFDTLARRRINASILFMKKIISGQMDSPTLRSQLNLNTGTRTFRNPEFIRLKGSTTKYGLNAPLNYACKAFNFAALFIDPTLPFYEFKKKLLRLPDTAFGDMTKLKSSY